MKKLFPIILFIVSCTVGSAQSLLQQVESLKPRYRFYEWMGKTNIYLTTFGTLERQFPRIIFHKVDLDKQSGLVTISGFINMTGEHDDTLTNICCFDVLVAKAQQEDKLSNIRHFGKTLHVSKNGNDSRQEGEFNLKVKLEPDDVLLIGNPGTLYWGAVVVPLGRAVR